ncbi:MAG: FKBP-type peptidyl-prolyl cis-trans isomerase [Acetivibrio sp.]
MKKKIIVTTLILSMMAALSGCGKKEPPSVGIVDEAAKVVTLGDYKGLEMTVAEVTEENVNEYINTNLLQSKATYEQIKDRKVKDGDTVNINYVGKKDGTAFEGGTDDSEAGMNLTIGSHSFIEGFEEGLIGSKPGDKIDLNLTFPKDYTKEDLQGAAVVFTVDVNYICGKSVVPELTEEFITANTEYDTLDDYKAFVKETLTTNNQATAKEAVWGQAVSNAKIKEYSQKDIDAALDSMKSYYTNMASYYQTDLPTVLNMYGTSEETFNEDMLETAKQIVGEKLVSLAIVKAEKAEITDELYKSKSEEYAKNYGYKTVDELEKAVPKETIREQIYIELGKQFVIDNATEKK